MQASLVAEAVKMATTQGRAPALVVNTSYEGKTINKSLRGKRQVFGICFHETATPIRLICPS